MSGLYLHIPFCERKCFYCSFVVAIGAEHRMSEYIQALTIEAKQYAPMNIDTLYWGGGTPSLLSEDLMQESFDAMSQSFLLKHDGEWTIEVNPEGIDLKKARLLKSLGVNRISLGIQSLNDTYLRYLGRNHNRQQAKKTFYVLREAGFENINVDLMFSFPQQNIDDLKNDISAITELKSEHVSVYSLTIEEHSRFYAQHMKLDDDQKQASEYILMIKMLGDAGFMQYEVSNFAKEGFASLHNMNYWQSGNYVGLGVGAHSHVDGRRYWNISKLSDYLKKTINRESTIENSENLNLYQRLIEAFIFGMRMNKGVSINKLEERFQIKFNGDDQKLIESFIENNLMIWDQDKIKVTDKGRLVLDEISARLV